MTIDIREQATENLRFIRGAMERAERMSAVSGAGCMAVGVIALTAMAIAANLPTLRERLFVWIVAAFVALFAGVFGSWVKGKRHGLRLIGDPGRRFLLCLFPVMLVGAVVTAALWRSDAVSLIPGLWMMLYGCGVLAAGTYAVTPIMQMGACFIVAGLVTYGIPGEWSNLLLGVSFGGLNLYFGYQVYRHHGG